MLQHLLNCTLQVEVEGFTFSQLPSISSALSPPSLSRMEMAIAFVKHMLDERYRTRHP